MENFVFCNPTKIIFGKETIPEIGKEAVKFGKKALLIYGGGSIKKNGIYDKVVKSLKENGVDFLEHSGVVSNPALTHAREGIKKVKENKLELIIAVGGGSVIDEAKAIAAGSMVDHDVWDFFINKAVALKAIPILTVLTLAATGSEMNNGAVVTNEETKEKFALFCPENFPKVSILDPETTYTVSQDYTAYGAVDAISHIIEPYFNHSAGCTIVQDNIIEGLFRSVMKAEESLLENPHDYNGRATAMWSATLALNGIPVAGVGNAGFPVHMIEHSLSAIYNIAHGAGLAIVIPAWLKYHLKGKTAKIAQMARKVFYVHEADDLKAAEKGISLLEEWFKKIRVPTRLGDVNIPKEDIKDISENAVRLATLWGLTDYTVEKISEILLLAV